MTDDLVKRLRDNCTCNFTDTPCGAEEECRNAFEGADRIEKLEVALTHIYAWYPISTFNPHQTIKEIKEFARKALEGKDE